jgi:UDP-2-acetamido-3-amino-2,3-dideoxy-glucuronate N-acetyltransferase
MSNATGRNYFAHESAIIDEPSSIGEGTKIWCFSHVMPGATIGRGCVLGQNVGIASKAIIGDGCRLQDNVTIFDGVVLEDHVFCGPSAVFTNVLNPRCEFPRRGAYQPTLVRRGTSIGANATIRCGVTLGAYSFIGAGAVVTKDVPDFALVVGVPARQAGWMSRYGEQLEFDKAGRAVCPHTGDEYQLQANKAVVLTHRGEKAARPAASLPI